MAPLIGGGKQVTKKASELVTATCDICPGLLAGGKGFSSVIASSARHMQTEAISSSGVCQNRQPPASRAESAS